MNLTLSEKVLTNLPNQKKVNFLVISLDNIIIYKKLDEINAEKEKKNKRTIVKRIHLQDRDPILVDITVREEAQDSEATLRK